MRLRGFAAFACCLYAGLLSGTALADGGLFIWNEETSTSQEAAVSGGMLSSNGQRGLFVEKEDGWDLYLQPGALSVEGAAWILPLPVIPVVHEADTSFMDQIEFATSPVFTTELERIYYCPESHGDDGGGCSPSLFKGGGAAGDATGNGTSGSDTSDETRLTQGVVKWGAGTVGDYEYEILTAEQGANLQAWLELNGYAVPDDLGKIVAPYIDDEYFFFAAKFVREEGDPENLSVVRFELKGLDDPEYPVMLTPVSTSGRLEFRVFIVAEAKHRPGNCDSVFIEGFYTQDEWVYGVDEIDSAAGEFEQLYLDGRKNSTEDVDYRTMAIEFMGRVSQQDVLDRLDAAGEGTDAPLTDAPSSWSEGLKKIIENDLVVSRLYGNFSRQDMERDVSFVAYNTTMEEPARYERTIHYEEWLSSNDPKCGEETSGAAPWDRERDHRYAGLALLAVGLFSALWSVRRRG